jgi:hypothetical protein
MPKTEQNIATAEGFILKVLEKNFRQEKVDPESLRLAAQRLCDSVPTERQKEPA